MSGLDTAAAQVPRGGIGALAPLRLPLFRMLWLASFVAQLCTWMNDVTAAWLMTTLTTSPGVVALVQTASTLPMFLLGLPTGALADILNRRRFLIFTQLWVTAVAGGACLAIWQNALSAPLLLALTFANGIGLAMRWPVLAALVPELVPKPQLQAALALNGITVNATRILGPLLGGLILTHVGGFWVFLLNAVLSLCTSVSLLRWRGETAPKVAPAHDGLWQAMGTGIRYVRRTPALQVVLKRVALFFVQASGLTALLPLVAHRLGNAATFTLLLAGLGLGAVTAVFLLPAIRQRWSPDRMVRGGTLLLSVAMAVVSVSPTTWVAALAMVAAGLAWMAVLNSLSTTAQMLLPNWVRARGMSIYQMALMGANACGAAFWGQVAAQAGLFAAMGTAAAGGLLIAWAARGLSVEEPEDEAENQPANGPS